MTDTKIKEYPKIDLHRHWDGDVRYEIAKRLADKDGKKMPAENKQAWYAWLEELRKAGLAKLFQEGFGFVSSLTQREENIELAAYEEVRNLRDDGIVYAEIRFAPQYHTGSNEYYGHKGVARLSYEQTIRALSTGLKLGEKDFGVKTKIIVCIGREATEEIGVEIVRAAQRSRDNGDRVVGIDLACDEWTYPPERHVKAFQLAFEVGLFRTVHAGEFGQDNYQNMVIAIQSLHANRLGHAREIAKHDDLVVLVVDNGIGIEMCPLSNLYCELISNVRDLGIKELLGRGVLVSVNTDDPAMFGYTLSDTILHLLERGGLSLDDIEKLQLNAIGSAFVREEERENIRNEFMRRLKLFEDKNA